MPLIARDGAADFDFLAGRWNVRHQRLQHRLARSEQWQHFGGTSHAYPLMGGRANVDDNVIDLPAGRYRAVTLRTYDPATRTWSIWWVDGRHPATLDTPMRGGFEDGIGTFFADDTFEGRPIRVRFIWSHVTARSARWQQAFSPDAGVTWETNWIMDFDRAGAASAC